HVLCAPQSNIAHVAKDNRGYAQHDHQLRTAYSSRRDTQRSATDSTLPTLTHIQPLHASNSQSPIPFLAMPPLCQQSVPGAGSPPRTTDIPYRGAVLSVGKTGRGHANLSTNSDHPAMASIHQPLLSTEAESLLLAVASHVTHEAYRHAVHRPENCVPLLQPT